MKKKYYVYAILDIDESPFYIGKGHGDRVIRHFSEYEISNCSNRKKVNKILKIRRLTGENPRFKIIKEGLTELEAFELEVSTIELIGRENLTNLTSGGEGASNPSEESRDKKSKSLKGRVFSDEHKKKLSESAKGKPGTRTGSTASDETKSKMSIASLGKKKSLAHRLSMSKSRQTPVIQKDDGGLVVNTFDSIKKAKLFFGKEINISLACKNKTKVMGFWWEKAPS